MVDASTIETPSAASPATDEAVGETEVLSGLARLALEMSRSFQAQGLAALAAGDLDRAGKAEARFSSLFLAIRRVVALQAKLRRQRQDAAASPIADAAAMVSELMALAEALAIGFQALALAALAANDLDRAGEAETRFSSLFLGIRRAVALKMKLREQREKARREAEQRRKSRQQEKDDRRQAVAQGVAQVIATAPDTDTDAKEQLTVDLWEKLTEDERIDVDLADRALPIEALIASLCRALGLPPHGTPPGGGPAAGGPAAGCPAAAAKARADDAGAGPKRQASGPGPHRASSNPCQGPPAKDTARPGDDRPSGNTGPPATAPPCDRRQWNEVDRAGHCRETERNALRRPQMPAPIRRHG